MIITNNQIFRRAIDRYVKYWAPDDYKDTEVVIVDEYSFICGELIEAFSKDGSSNIYVIGCRNSNLDEYISLMKPGSIDKIFSRKENAKKDGIRATIYIRCVGNSILEMLSTHGRESMMSALCGAMQCIVSGLDLWKSHYIQYSEYKDRFLIDGKSEWNRFKSIFCENIQLLRLAGFPGTVNWIVSKINLADAWITTIQEVQVSSRGEGIPSMEYIKDIRDTLLRVDDSIRNELSTNMHY